MDDCTCARQDYTGGFVQGPQESGYHAIVLSRMYSDLVWMMVFKFDWLELF